MTPRSVALFDAQAVDCIIACIAKRRGTALATVIRAITLCNVGFLTLPVGGLASRKEVLIAVEKDWLDESNGSWWCGKCALCLRELRACLHCAGELGRDQQLVAELSHIADARCPDCGIPE